MNVEALHTAFVEECGLHLGSESACGCIFERLNRNSGFEYTDDQIQRIAEVFGAGSITAGQTLLKQSGDPSDADLAPKLHLAEYAFNPCLNPEKFEEMGLPPGMSNEEAASFGLIEE
ncbi:hypothetical protein [Paracoccus liaowanqingii]|nr:hypothetical protein [Paracoccus liaowanqingii]